MNNEFKVALERARAELTQIEAQEKVLAQRKSQLLRSIAALTPLVLDPSNPAPPTTLADAIRDAAETFHAMSPGIPIKPTDIRAALLNTGFDLSSFSNPLASIHTAMKRMAAAGEFEAAGDLDFGGGYLWKGRKNTQGNVSELRYATSYRRNKLGS
jgi:hypothetical protein